MYPPTRTLGLLATFLACAHVVLAGPSGWVVLINGSPYDWKKSYTSQNRMHWDWPDVIPAGTSLEQHIEFNVDHHDTAAEAIYTLVGTESPKSFEIRGRISKQHKKKRVEIAYHETLASLNNPENSVINLGFQRDHTVSFVLAGSGHTTSPFISSNPPRAWMQATLGTVGDMALREISMPESHDAGMSQVKAGYCGTMHNCGTQSGNIYNQLDNGARWFDIRPFKNRHGRYSTGHFSKTFGGMAVGGEGRGLDDIVNDINAWTAKNPGELIVLDISHEMKMPKFQDWQADEWQDLYKILMRIEDRWTPSSETNPGDLTVLPLSTFITPGSKSAVLFRLPDYAPAPDPKKFSKRDTDPEDENNLSDIVEAIDTDPRFDPNSRTTPGPDAFSDLDDATDMRDPHMPMSLNISTAIAPPKFQRPNGFHNATHPLTLNATTYGPCPTCLICPAHIRASTIRQYQRHKKPNPIASPPSPPLPPVGPGKAPFNAFVSASSLAYTGTYSDTGDFAQLSRDQISKLEQFRSGPPMDRQMHRSTWTITQHIGKALNAGRESLSIKGLARRAKGALFSKLWGEIRNAEGLGERGGFETRKGELRGTWPNLIEIDDVWSQEVATLCMGINAYFARPVISKRTSDDGDSEG